MSGDGWRTSVRWVVAHPTEAKVLVAGWDGAVRLPGSEQPGRVWTAEPGEVLPGLRNLLGADAIAGRPAPRGQLPVDRGRDDAAGRASHVPQHGLVAAPGAGRPELGIAGP